MATLNTNTIPYTTQQLAALNPHYAAQNTVWSGPSIIWQTTAGSYAIPSAGSYAIPSAGYQAIPIEYEYDVASDSYIRKNSLSANSGVHKPVVPKPVVPKEEFSEEEISKAEELMRELDSAAQV